MSDDCLTPKDGNRLATDGHRFIFLVANDGNHLSITVTFGGQSPPIEVHPHTQVHPYTEGSISKCTHISRCLLQLCRGIGWVLGGLGGLKVGWLGGPERRELLGT